MAPQGFRFTPQVIRVFFACSLFWLVSSTSFGAKSKFTWTPATKEELAETAAKIEPGAAVEVLLNRIEVDDDSNVNARQYHIWQRYKIYDPERAAEVLSLSYWDSASKDSSFAVEARLTLPSSEIKEFDKKSFLERTVENKSPGSSILKLLTSAKEKSTQHYLAIAGVERGSVLEVQMTYRIKVADIPPADVWVMQFEDMPVRKSEYIHTCARDSFGPTVYTLNNVPLDTKTVNKRRVIKASASDLPAMHEEPHAGPVCDYSELTVVTIEQNERFYVPRPDNDELNKKIQAGRSINRSGPWRTWAHYMQYYANQYGKPTSRIKTLALSLCEGAESEEEKGRRIHNYVLRHYQKYIRHSLLKKLRSARSTPVYLNDVLDFESLKRALSSEDFLLLAYALNKAAGLDVYLIALPDRSFMRFNPQLVSEHFLTNLAIGISSDGRWFFSAPHQGQPLPFDMLPLANIGQLALVGINGQEFIPIPAPPPETSVMAQSGSFRLDTEGTLSGSGQISLTGYYAVLMRIRLSWLDESMKKKEVKEALLSELPAAASIEIDDIKDPDQIEEPVVIHFSLNWEGFATRVDKRFILKPSVFRISARSPFVASTRKTPIVMQLNWKETDHVVIELPKEYSLEDPSGTPQYPGKAINYTSKLAYAPKPHHLILDRDYSVSFVEAKPSMYPAIKSLYESIQQSDEHEIVLRRKTDGQPDFNPAARSKAQAASEQPATAPGAPLPRP